MNNNNGIAKNDCDGAPLHSKDVNGSPTHLTFYIYQIVLHDFGNYWVLYIELSGDFRQVPTDTFHQLRNILAVSKEYKQMVFSCLIRSGIFAKFFIKIIIIAQTCQSNNATYSRLVARQAI